MIAGDGDDALWIICIRSIELGVPQRRRVVSFRAISGRVAALFQVNNVTQMKEERGIVVGIYRTGDGFGIGRRDGIAGAAHHRKTHLSRGRDSLILVGINSTEIERLLAGGRRLRNVGPDAMFGALRLLICSLRHVTPIPHWPYHSRTRAGGNTHFTSVSRI